MLPRLLVVDVEELCTATTGAGSSPVVDLSLATTGVPELLELEELMAATRRRTTQKGMFLWSLGLHLQSQKSSQLINYCLRLLVPQILF